MATTEHNEWTLQPGSGFSTLLFVCAICGRDIRDWPDRRGPDAQLAPVCRFCERVYTERVGQPKRGAFMDRRRARQILALASALANQAGLIEWETKYGDSARL